MKSRVGRFLVIGGLVLAVGLSSAVGASAQGPTPFGRRGALGLGGDKVHENIAEMLGLSVEELSLQLWGGRTLADLAERAGVDLAEIQESVAASREDTQRAAIAQAVQEGRIIQAHADWLLEGLDAGYSASLAGTRRSLLGAHLMTRGDERPQEQALAEALGLTTDELRTQLRDGVTLADLAEEAGVSLQALKDASDAARQAQVRTAIEVALENESITAEQADWLLRGLEAGYWNDGLVAGGMRAAPGRMPGGRLRGMDGPGERPGRRMSEI